MPSATLIITLVVLVVVIAADKIVRKRVSEHIDALYSAGNGSGLLDYLDGHLVKYLYPAFNRAYMRVNAYERMGDSKGEEQELALLLSEKRLDKKQRQAVVLRGFEFYLKEGKAKKARGLLDEIEGWDGFPSKDMYTVLYKVVAEKSADYIPLCEDKLKSANGAEKLQLLYLLSKQYKNAGQADKAREYETQSVDFLSELRSGGVDDSAA